MQAFKTRNTNTPLIAAIKSCCFLLILIICNSTSQAQTALDYNTLDSLQALYSLYPNKKHSSYPPPPLPPKAGMRTAPPCTKQYDIPVSELTKLYPFNADSIFVAAPASTFDEERRIVAQVTPQDLAVLTAALYNYDIKRKKNKPIITTLDSHELPGFTLLFYHNGEKSYVDVFFKHEQRQTILLDSFPEEMNICWGKCSSYSLLKEFVYQAYGYDVGNETRYIECCDDYNINITPLEN